MKHFALVGFANSGKSTLFNALAQARQTTGNWTGVTVAAKQSRFVINNEPALLSDLPGLPGLSQRHNQSHDLQISRRFLQENQVDCIVNVVDATQLQRQLCLTLQLLELGLPMLLVVSKVDRLGQQKIDIDKLSNQLGCPVVAVNGLGKKAGALLSQAMLPLPQNSSPLALDLPAQVQQTLADEELSLLQYEQHLAHQGSSCNSAAQTLLQVLEARYRRVEQIVTKVTISEHQQQRFTDLFDKVILHPAAGMPVFLLMMYLLFMFAINVGGAFIDFFDILAGAIFVEYPLHWLAQYNLPQWLLTVVEGFGSGLQTVATFIPIIASLFIGLTLLESSGYLARAAFVVDGLMQRLGLPGKAFVPLIVGFGCTVPAVMAARVMDSERERITTVMMSPFMSCGARLPVYALFAAAFFPESGQNLVFLLYIVGIVAAILTGLLLKYTLLPGNSSLSIMELPLYELPRLAHVSKRVWQRTRSFIFGAGQTIVVVVCLLNFFNSLGTDGEFGHHDSEKSILSQTSQVITPLLSPMGIEQDNWQAGVGIITGLFAKEALVATFNSLYTSAHETAEAPASLLVSWQEALDSIGSNMGDIQAKDPLNVDVGDVSDIQTAAAEQEVDVSTFAAMQQAFNGQLGAFSYLLFILLYTPCAAAMGAIKNEVGSRWAGFAALWSFTLAYLSATLCYQLGSITVTPVISVLYIVVVMSILLAIFLWLKHQGKKILTIPTKVSYDN